FRNKTNGDVYSEYMKLEKLGHMGHVREYTPKEMVIFLQKCGFSVKAIIYRGGPNYKSTWKNVLARLVVKIAPHLSNYFTIVAVKLSSYNAFPGDIIHL